MTRLPPLLCATLVFCLGLLLLPSAGLAGSTYSITADPATDIPTETITHEGEEYTIDSVSRISPDDAVEVTTSVPADEGYNIYLRGPDNQIISSERKVGDSTHTIDNFGTGEAGSYAITIQKGGMTKAVTPVVIQGYDIAVSAPQRVEQGESVTVEATVQERQLEKHSSLEYVQLVVGNEKRELQPKMEQIDETTYRTTFSTADLDKQSYRLYVGVRGDETVRDQAEILAISEPTTLTIGEQSASDEPDDSPGSGDETPQTQTPTDELSTSTPTATATTSTPTQTTVSTDVTSPDTTSTPTQTDNVLTPSSPTAQSTSEEDGAGFSVPIVFVSLLCLVGLLRRR